MIKKNPVYQLIQTMKQSLLNLLITFLLLIALHNPVKAQYVLTEADAQFELFNYTKAIDLYEQAYKKKESLHAAERLAACYKYQSNYKQTESWFAIAMGMKDSPAENTLNYAMALQSNSKYEEARAAYQNYAALDKTVTEKQKNLWISSCDSAIKWMKSPGSYNVKNERLLNSSQSDWGAAKYNDQITYASDRGHKYAGAQDKARPFLKFDGAKVPDKDLYGWTGNGYLSLYINHGSDSSSLFPLKSETVYHVGPATFSADGKEVYFTRTRIPGKPDYKGNLATVNVEIYSSRMDETSKTWSAPVAFKYNNVNEWSVGDPYLTADGKRLYFVSNMPGGKGGTDIYACVKDADGNWLIPVNLTEINTAGNERSPSFDGGNNFYFSSDGYPGMGGLDIFKSQISGKAFLKPLNLGYPINSPQDDFAYAAFSDSLAYLSSNRLEGMGSDDIYSIARQILLALKLEGQVFNKKDGLPLSSALVTLKGKNNTLLKVQTDDKGFYSFKLDRNINYDLTAEKTGFRSSDTSFVTAVSLVKDFYLSPIELNKPIKLENIYYDFDKSNIRADAAIELDKLVKIMKDNPTIWIELGSHTDSRGDDQYNQWLSQSRANSAVQYIIERGIEKNRISAKGYGESRLLNRCANGVKCTEKEHQLNRRTEFTIVKQ
jgi:peptidoglycan-associated lipoprotein